MAGTTRITASAVLGQSGKPVRVYGYTMRSGAGGIGLVQLFNGTDNTGTEKWAGTGNQDAGAIVNFSPTYGKFFPGGCYVQIDGNVTYAEIDWQQETTA